MHAIRLTGRRALLAALGALAALALSAAAGFAQVGGGFDLSWSTVDGGGATFSTGGDYQVGGTIGQPDAGTAGGSGYSLAGGFWPGARGPARLIGHLTWQGRPPQPDPANQLPFTLTLRLGNQAPVSFAAQQTDAGGYFTLSVSQLPVGNYTWWVKGPQYLASGGPVTLSGAPQTPVELGLQRAGDVNDDNLVDITDFSLLRASFGQACGGPSYDGRADFSGDCLVDITDFSLLRANFGQAGAPPP